MANRYWFLIRTTSISHQRICRAHTAHSPFWINVYNSWCFSLYPDTDVKRRSRLPTHKSNPTTPICWHGESLSNKYKNTVSFSNDFPQITKTFFRLKKHFHQNLKTPTIELCDQSMNYAIFHSIWFMRVFSTCRFVFWSLTNSFQCPMQ